MVWLKIRLKSSNKLKNDKVVLKNYQKGKMNRITRGIIQSKTSLQAFDDSFAIEPSMDDYGPSQIS
jgi:hypothetical protein